MYTIIKIMMCDELTFEVKNGILFQCNKGFALVAACNGRYFDLVDGSEREVLKRDYDGYIENDILENTIYIENIVPYEETTEKMLMEAAKIIEYNKMVDELKEKKKIIDFPQKQLY